jgi:hypothetical protein
VYEGDGNRSFTDRGCHALEATSADVADREYAGQTRFEQMRSTSERPMSGGEILGRQVWSGPNKSVRVQRNASV